MGLLSAAIWLPIAVGVLLFAVGHDGNARAVRWVALIGSILSLLVTLPLISGFDTSTAAMQFVEKGDWIERFNVHYHLGVDGLSMWFVPLTAFITVIVVISAWQVPLPESVSCRGLVHRERSCRDGSTAQQWSPARQP